MPSLTAATYTGIEGRTCPARPYGRTLSRTSSPSYWTAPASAAAQTARIASTVSRRRRAGCSPGAPSQSVRIRRVPVPSPRTNRPPESSSRSSAVTAVSSGERPNAQAIPVPSSTELVRRAAPARASGPEWLWNSGAQTESNPEASARAASSTLSRWAGSSSSRPSRTPLLADGVGQLVHLVSVLASREEDQLVTAGLLERLDVAVHHVRGCRDAADDLARVV